MQRLIAITGGIGSGKSVISKILRTWGFKVFDCDIEAKILMDSSEAIKRRIVEEISQEAIVNGKINRSVLSGIVFRDKDKLSILNSIVHGEVRKEILRWAERNSNCAILFVETAILYTSGLNDCIFAELRVEASEDVRLERVIKRNGLTAEHIKSRIDSQRKDTKPDNPVETVFRIDNSGDVAVLPQIKNVLNLLF